MQINYVEIANFIDRTEANIKYMKKNNPQQLEVIKMGALCKKYNISVSDLEAVLKLKENIK